MPSTNEVTNPKLEAAKDKPTMHAVPVNVLRMLGQVMQHGADKYGAMNWLETGVDSDTYYDAIIRHLLEWQEGLDADADSGLHPLVHVAASCFVVVSAHEADMLEDKRHTE